MHVFVAVSYSFLYLRRSPSLEYRAFSLMSVAAAIYSLGGAWVESASTLQALTYAQQVQFLSLAVVAYAFIELGFLVIDNGNARVLRWMFAWSAITVGFTVGGFLFDANRNTLTSEAIPSHARSALIASLSPAGIVITGCGFLFVAYSTVRFFCARAGGKPIRPLYSSGMLLSAALAHDVVVSATEAAERYAFEHALLGTSVMLNFMFLRGFVVAGDTLEERTHELKHSYDELRYVEEELVRKEQLAAVGELSAVIAHEVRNPLGVLKNAVAGLRRQHIRDEEQRVLLGVVDEETDRLNRLVRDLLTYARPVEPQSLPLPLNHLVRRALDLARRGTARSELVEFDIDVSGAPSHVDGDRDLLERAFINITENAMEAMPTGGTLSVRARNAEMNGRPAVALSFHDTGEGMDTMVRARARDPFFTTRPSGTGLGLAIVERVVRAHEGTVELSSGTRDGTTVTVTLPRKETPRRSR